MSIIETVREELLESIRTVLDKHGLEMHGELRGLIQQKDQPDTATGWRFQLGNGVPKGWKQ